MLKFRLAMKLTLETISEASVIFVTKTVEEASIRLHVRFSRFPNTLLENILRAIFLNIRMFDADVMLTFNLPRTAFKVKLNVIDITRMEFPVENVRDRIGLQLIGRNPLDLNLVMLDHLAHENYLIALITIERRPWNIFKRFKLW